MRTLEVQIIGTFQVVKDCHELLWFSREKGAKVTSMRVTMRECEAYDGIAAETGVVGNQIDQVHVASILQY